jgi:NADH-quinone oxidoreductase subunit J
MNASTVIFYILAALILGGGIFSVTTRKIFRAAIYLLFSLIGIAGLYFYLDYEFIAAVQIIVYVGGIVVLIIFSVFLTHESGNDMKRPAITRALFSLLAALFGLALTLNIINKNSFVASTQAPMKPTVANIGTQMLSTQEHGYILPFEVVSMLLLAAMVGCIVIAIRARSATLKVKGKEDVIVTETFEEQLNETL